MKLFSFKLVQIILTWKPAVCQFRIRPYLDAGFAATHWTAPPFNQSLHPAPLIKTNCSLRDVCKSLYRFPRLFEWTDVLC